MAADTIPVQPSKLIPVPEAELTLGHKLKVLAGLVVPAIGVPGLAWQVTHNGLSASQLVVMIIITAAAYLFSGFGITVGFHRMLTHRSFTAVRWLWCGLVVAGCTALQGPPKNWVADHRKHHAFSDHAGDPHSPHGHGAGFRGIVAGLWHAHMGWLFTSAGAPPERYAKELVDDRFINMVGRMYGVIALISLFGIPALVGLAIMGTATGALYGIVWIGLARACFLLQFTFCINSVCHVFGKKTFQTEDESRDVWWLRLATMGESNHNGHHAFPSSYRHGLQGGLDLSAMFIWLMEKVHLVTEVRRIAPERIQQKRVTT